MQFVLCLVLVFGLDGLVSGKPVESDGARCGYRSCHPVDPNRLNVHLVAHSHDDVGWLKTVDQYFYGTKGNIQFAGIQYIIGSSIDALRANPDRRYIQVETAFFWKWWKKQSDYMQNVVRDLVNGGRLEIINGAWSMNDEAATHYHSIIDQFTLGLQTINDTLGECGRPKIGWQIDPFGHSREMASIFASLGYEAVFFARLDYRDSKLRHDTNNLEMIWTPSPNLGAKSEIFAGVVYDFYNTPAYFCWDVLCGDLPIVDDAESPDYNEKIIVERFANYVLKGAKYYKTNNLLVTMGGDFTFQAAEMFFNNMDKLIAGFKKFRPDINVIYSTPSCYTKAVNDEAKLQNVSFSAKTDDFFPYASNPHSVWTGYYTSRPNSKRFERQGNNILQVVKQLVVFELAKSGKDLAESLRSLREIMGVMQHHDAITGTEKQHVVNDYVRLLHKGIRRAEGNVGEIFTSLLDGAGGDLKFESCLLANVSFCPIAGSDKFMVTIYNPLSRKVSNCVRLPVQSKDFKILGPKGTQIDYAILPAMANFSEIFPLNSFPYELVFKAANVPAMGLQQYQFQSLPNSQEEPAQTSQLTNYQFGNAFAGFEIDSSGYLSSVTIKNFTIKIRQEFLFYYGANGTNFGEKNRASGAYVFRPAEGYPQAMPFHQKMTFKAFKNDLVQEVHQSINPWITQIIRVYTGEDHVEFDWMVGPIDIRSGYGVEVVSRFSTDLETNGTFFTDSNGREMVKRQRNFRETYEYSDEEPAAGNYYPVTSRIVVRDVERNLELGVVNDRAQGGTSFMDGDVELMVHRRLLNDDDFGVIEALNELEFGEGVVARGKHYLTFGQISPEKRDQKSSAALQRNLAQKTVLAPWIFLANSTLQNLDDLQTKEFSGLKRDLPENVQILTLEVVKGRKLILRLEHLFERGEDCNLSNPATIDLNNLFELFEITSIRETTLGANQWIEQNHKLAWNSQEELTVSHEEHISEGSATANPLLITLNPMEIRTFIIDF